MALTGSAPSATMSAPPPTCQACQRSHARGTAASACRPGRAPRQARSVPASKVPAPVEPGHLRGVSAEGPGGAAVGAEAVAFAGEPALGLLAPARVVDVGVHVGEEAVLARLQRVPGGARGVAGELDGDDGLDALEAVLPRHDQA